MTQPHGTYARYQEERKAGITTCELCRAAQSEYVRAWRKGGAIKIRERALNQLIRQHPGDFELLIDIQKSKETD